MTSTPRKSFFPGPESNPGPPSPLLSCVFCLLWSRQAAPVPFVFRDLDILRSRSHLFCRLSFRWVCLMFPWDYNQAMHFWQKYHTNGALLSIVRRGPWCWFITRWWMVITWLGGYCKANECDFPLWLISHLTGGYQENTQIPISYIFAINFCIYWWFWLKHLVFTRWWFFYIY